MSGKTYNNVLGGKLKLKGSALPSGVAKKKKTEKQKETAVKVTEAVLAEEEPKKKEYIVVVQKTAAELAFEEGQRKREKKTISKLASKSHREKVEDFNKKLTQMTEHYDIPKVGPG